jgi:hypothetical protein
MARQSLPSKFVHAKATPGRPHGLQSTIATHGLPREHALTVPLQLEALARSRNVVPCTLGMLDGVICRTVLLAVCQSNTRKGRRRPIAKGARTPDRQPTRRQALPPGSGTCRRQ